LETLGGVIRSGVTHEVCWYCASPPTPQGETSGVALFFWQKMKIKNWKKFQHFKDRKPPWVKLYRDLLDDLEWHELDPKAAKVLVMLWLIASEDEGNIPPIKQLAFRLRLSEKETEVCIIKLSHWLEHGDNDTISTGYQDDAPETETETETETEAKCISPPSGELPSCNHQGVIDLYHKHLPTLRRIEVWNETRKGYLRQRWREVADELAKTKEIQSSDILGWFAEFFEHIGTSKFLTGRVNDKSGRSFVADLEWILKPSNFAKIVEGKYHGTN
jgi:hypothetical protein